MCGFKCYVNTQASVASLMLYGIMLCEPNVMQGFTENENKH